MSSLSVCDEWLTEPLRNPRTKRPITYMGPTYRELLKECGQKAKTPTPIVDNRPSPPTSSKKSPRHTPLQKTKTPTPIVDHRPSPPNSSPKKDVVIYIKGLKDCREKTWDNYLQAAFSNKYSQIHVECDDSTLNIFKDIVKTYCYMKPSNTNRFVVSIYEKINKLLGQNYNILVIGHSYGGSVAARLAMMFNIHPKNNKLRFVTLGSIFNIKKNEAPNVNIVQYMYSNDVALKCANIKSYNFASNTSLKYYYDDDTNIIWLPKPKDMNKRWDIHNAYYPLCNDIIYSKDIYYPMNSKTP